MKRLLPFALLLVAGVARADEPALAPGRDDVALEAFALAAAAAHDAADRLAPGEAAAKLLSALPEAAPAGPEARLVEAELAGRASALLREAGRPKEALQVSRRALDRQVGTPETAGRAILRLREGQALEALGDDEAALVAWAEAIGVASRLLAGGAK